MRIPIVSGMVTGVVCRSASHNFCFGEIPEEFKNTDDADYFCIICGDTAVKLYHSQDCCESVTLEDVVGYPEYLVGSYLISVEACYSEGDQLNSYDESYTWTYYKIETSKGGLSLRFYGESNGYYSEEVDCKVFAKGDFSKAVYHSYWIEEE